MEIGKYTAMVFLLAFFTLSCEFLSDVFIESMKPSLIKIVFLMLHLWTLSRYAAFEVSLKDFLRYEDLIK